MEQFLCCMDDDECDIELRNFSICSVGTWYRGDGDEIMIGDVTFFEAYGLPSVFGGGGLRNVETGRVRGLE